MIIKEQQQNKQINIQDTEKKNRGNPKNPTQKKINQKKGIQKRKDENVE